MAKRSINSRSSIRIKPDGFSDGEEEFLASLDAPIIETTKLALRKNLKLNIIGPETGNTYQFSGAGSVVDADNRDVAKLLEKGLNGKSCCGSPSTPYFEIVR